MNSRVKTVAWVLLSYGRAEFSTRHTSTSKVWNNPTARFVKEVDPLTSYGRNLNSNLSLWTIAPQMTNAGLPISRLLATQKYYESGSPPPTEVFRWISMELRGHNFIPPPCRDKSRKSKQAGKIPSSSADAPHPPFTLAPW